MREFYDKRNTKFWIVNCVLVKRPSILCTTTKIEREGGREGGRDRRKGYRERRGRKGYRERRGGRKGYMERRGGRKGYRERRGGGKDISRGEGEKRGEGYRDKIEGEKRRNDIR